MNSNLLFTAFDVETTGLVPGVDRLVEMAGVLFRGQEVVDTWSSLVDPGMSMPPDARNVNGITDSMVIGQPRAADVLPCFLAFLARGTPVAHNAAFDVGFLCPDIDSGRVVPPPGPVLDTRALARRAFPGRYSYSLANLARDFHLAPAGDAHRALADAFMCGNLLMTCMETLFPGREPCVQELASLSGPLDFSAHAPRQHVMAAVLERARADGQELEIDYRSGRGETTRRRIRPLKFTRVGSSIAVIAWCYLRGGSRTFILDSIVAARPIEARPIEARPGAARPGAARPGAARSVEARPGAARSVEARPGAARPAP